MMALIIFIVMGVGVLLGIANNLLYTQQNIVTVANKTLTFANNTPTTIENFALVSGSETVYGGRDAFLMPLNKGRNYTIDYSRGKITPLNETVYDWWNTSLYNVSYRYYPASYASNSMVRTIYSAILPLISILILLWLWWHFRNA